MAKVVLLFGGPSSERLVSFASAQNVAPLIPEAALWFWSKAGAVYLLSHEELLGHERPFEAEYVPKVEPRWPTILAALEDAETRLLHPTFFLALHGVMGEDGVVQGYLEDFNYKFTGSDSKVSALAFDKVKTKEVAQAAGIRVARSFEADSATPDSFRDTLREAVQEFGSTVVKPIRSGSSDGLTFISDPEEIDVAVVRLLARKPEAYLIEERISGREITVGLIETRDALEALPASEVIVEREGVFDYAGKYLGKGSKEITPAELSAEEMTEAQEIAKRIHQALGCRGYSRTDLMLSSDGFVLLEINTLPGLSKMSFIPQQLRVAGIDFKDFVHDQLAIARRK